MTDKEDFQSFKVSILIFQQIQIFSEGIKLNHRRMYRLTWRGWCYTTYPLLDGTSPEWDIIMLEDVHSIGHKSIIQ